jgi:predicted ATPase/DNA-binding XRE family transcriptional regulator
MEAEGRSDFGTLLRQLRLDAAMTQQELAERAKLSVEAISQLERGARTRPQRETVVLLARALDLSPERHALLSGAISGTHPPRRTSRNKALDASLLRLVRSDTEGTGKHNLPQQLTSLIGRQREEAEIATLLRQHRLVTIVGAGGVGKTRIAMQVASQSLNGCPDGAWFVDLAPIKHEALIENAVSAALQLPSTIGSALDVVLAYLKTRRLLLILDNCEHVISAARKVAANIIESCSSVRILSTSREALDVHGERVYRLPSLAVPPELLRNALSVLPYSAVALFVDRARAVNTGFAFTDDNAPDVAAICRRLDGIPLAIELAAARVTVLAPRQIAKRLEQCFRLLTGGNPGAVPRHRTMTALIDWSYGLLTSREQRFFEQLSVFAGGCTLEAATAVCSVDQEDDLDVIDFVESLVTKSLLVAELNGDEHRYRLTELSRQYARDKLVARGNQEESAQRHALFYVQLAEGIERSWDTTPDRQWLPRAQLELENWRAALEWVLGERCDVMLGQRFVAVWRVLWRSFPLDEGRRWVRTALELADETTPAHVMARLEYADAEASQQCNEFEAALAAGQRALSWSRKAGDRLQAAWAQNLIGAQLGRLGRLTDCESLLREALAAARGLGDRRLVSSILRNVGDSRRLAGDFATARHYLTEALELAKAFGGDLAAASTATYLAQNEIDAGDPAAVLPFMVDALTSLHSLRYSIAAPGIASCIYYMANALMDLGRYEEARPHANEALELARELRLTGVVVESLRDVATLATLRSNIRSQHSHAKYAGAARVLGFVEARGGQPVLQQEYDRAALAMLRHAIGAQGVEILMAAGATMTDDEAIAEARALEQGDD